MPLYGEHTCRQMVSTGRGRTYPIHSQEAGLPPTHTPSPAHTHTHTQYLEVPQLWLYDLDLVTSQIQCLECSELEDNRGNLFKAIVTQIQHLQSHKVTKVICER